MKLSEIRQELLALSEPGYREFTQKLTPNARGVLGVRLPALQSLSKRILRDRPLEFLAADPRDSFEEVMLQGMVLAGMTLPLEQRWTLLEPFVARVDNWSVCDSTAMRCKWMQKEREAVWARLEPWLLSPREFTVRFALVALLAHFMEPEWLDRVFSACDRAAHPGYYARMAVAWAVSACMAKAPEETLKYLGRDSLEKFTHNKAISKCCESYRVSPEDKAALRLMRRK